MLVLLSTRDDSGVETPVLGKMLPYIVTTISRNHYMEFGSWLKRAFGSGIRDGAME
jgi:hypothetical protein